MKKSIMREYARLIATKGGNVRKGQDVIIMADLDQPDFVCMLVEECYRAGARKVTVDWSYQPADKIIQKKTGVRALSEVPEWEEKRMAHRVATLPVRIYLESEDPFGMKGVDQAKISKASQARMKILKPYRDQMENKYQWCIAGIPGASWAKRVFPNLKKNQAVEKLWQSILDCTLIDWDAHNKHLHDKCNQLNGYHLKALRYKASNGTDFRVGLIDTALFMGGSEHTEKTDIEYNPNMPSQEIFTSPMKGKAEGIVYATKPLSYRGEVISDFWFRFENGKVVDFGAKQGYDLLKEMVNMDEGSSYLGECALVPWNNPINNSGVLFYNTLFDENACCHLALGVGFTNVLKDYDKYTTKECFEKGINDSIIHVDFMIGTADLSIDGITEYEKTVPIFRNGNFV